MAWGQMIGKARDITKKKAAQKAAQKAAENNPNLTETITKTTQTIQTIKLLTSPPALATYALTLTIIIIATTLTFLAGLASAITAGATLDNPNCIPIFNSPDDLQNYVTQIDDGHIHEDDPWDGTTGTDGTTGAPSGTITGAKPTTETSGKIRFPVQALPSGGYFVTSKYGPRSAPVAGASTWHKGTDFRAPRHHPILAIADGIVTRIVNPPEYHRISIIEIRHLYNNTIITSAYKHMDTINVTVGQNVSAGQKIGGSGNRGPSSAPHLHFELWLGTTSNTHTNPLNWLQNAKATMTGTPLQPPNSIGLPNNPPEPGSAFDTPNTGFANTCDTSNTDQPTGNQPGAWGGHQNGQIPLSELASPLFNPNVKLRPDAATALEKLNTAYKTRFNQNITITDHYRSYEGQVQCQKNKGNMCAKPGTSNHGWGLAIDFGGGINSFGTPQHEWMRNNASDYGWHHPSWAQAGGSKPEPWHWEYTPQN